jgi:hypothetical protein
MLYPYGMVSIDPCAPDTWLTSETQNPNGPREALFVVGGACVCTVTELHSRHFALVVLDLPKL